MDTDLASTEANPRSRPRPARRVGYVVAAAVNLGLVWVTHQLLDWGWPRFLTDAFDEVLPLLTVSLVASAVANLLFVWFDRGWFKSAANVVTSSISFVVALRLYQVFPFDFSGYAHDWSWLLRLALVVAMVGTAIGTVVEAVRVVTWPARAHRAQHA